MVAPNKNEPSIDGKNTDLFRFVEEFILGAILFTGRYIRTTWEFLFCPSRFEKFSLKNHKEKGFDQHGYVRPLTYLLVNQVAFLFVSQRWMEAEPLFKYLPMFSHNGINKFLQRVSTAIAGLDTTSIVMLILPFILGVALYATLLVLILRVFRRNSPFLLQLRIVSYFVGNYLSLMVLTFGLLIVSRELDFPLLAVLPLAILALYPWCIFRYMTLFRKTTSTSWPITIVILILTLLVSWFLILVVAESFIPGF